MATTVFSGFLRITLPPAAVSKPKGNGDDAMAIHDLLVNHPAAVSKPKGNGDKFRAKRKEPSARSSSSQ